MGRHVIGRIWALLGVLGFTLAACSLRKQSQNPSTTFVLSQSESAIRTWLLKQTPLGTTIDQVRSYIDKRSWRVRGYDEKSGFLKQDLPRPSIVGESSIRGNLGNYGFPFRTNVTAFWGFDHEGKLVDVWVWKTTDAL